MGKLSPEAIHEAVVDCIQSVAPEADFTTLRADKPWRDQLEIDSFDFQNIMVAIHKRLGVDIPESDYRKITTLEQFVAHVVSRLPG